MERSDNLKHPHSGLYSLVLAAGLATRFGAPKQLAEFEGESLVRRALGLAVGATGQKTVLIVGAQWQRVVDECRGLAPFIIRNERYASGMASSISCGTRAVDPAADALLVLLADQPLITNKHLLALETRWRASPSSIIATEFDGMAGPPVIFPARYFSALIALSGDAGARSVIKDNSEQVITVPLADAAVDIDTPADLARL